jgi:hypothetical protein
MHSPKWSIFYDFHTQVAQPDVGETFDADAFTGRLKECGVDFIVFHARCNLGMAYYDTKVGIRHPSLRYDLIGRLSEACRRNGIALSVYFNVGLSHEEGLLHRDWLKVQPDGRVYGAERMDHFFRLMCYNTGYADHLLEMIREVVSGYPVAGLFLDCMHRSPCIGVECIREMKQRGIDWRDPAQAAEFARFSQVRMARRIREAALAIRPDLMLYFNGVSAEDQAEIGTYLEYECLPTGGWGYEALPVYARYLRTLGKQVLNMTGRFHRSWGDFGGIRSEAGLEYDCVYGLANGLRPTIGDHYHPRGDLNPAVFDLVHSIYGRLQKLEPWIAGATPAVDTAVLASGPEALGDAVIGATRMLCELKAQFDVLTPASRWQDYRLLVLPDTTVLDESLAGRVRAHLERGGGVLASHRSGLDPARQGFVLPEWGVRYVGDDPLAAQESDRDQHSNFALPKPAYFQAVGAAAAGLPDMPVNCYERGVVVEALPGSTVLARVVSAYFPRQWDGEHHHLYIAPDRLTEQPMATVNGRVAYASYPLFTSYYRYAPLPVRALVGNLMAAVLPEPLLRVEGLPSFGRAMVTQQPTRRMVWLTAYVPERRGLSIDMIEEPLALRDVLVRLRADGRPPRRVYLAPSGAELPWQVSAGYIVVTVPELTGYAVVVVE